ncbi:MAG: hypothetical protein MK031_01095 [Alphaproteobacteria bacterium]|nr:hypothetical protein [Alphaproteobacteria bacterium]
MPDFIRRNLVLVCAFCLISCGDIPVQTQTPELTYSHLGLFRLDVSEIQIVNKFVPAMRLPNIEHLMPVAPAFAAKSWAEDRLQKKGSSGRRAIFTILDASVVKSPLRKKNGVRGTFTIDQSELYKASVKVRLEIFNLDGSSAGAVEAASWRSKSVPENITLNDRDKVWFHLTEAVTNELNSELERSIPKFLGNYLR